MKLDRALIEFRPTNGDPDSFRLTMYLEQVSIAVNGSRGLATVLLSDPWRLTLWDMEDEEQSGALPTQP